MDISPATEISASVSLFCGLRQDKTLFSKRLKNASPILVICPDWGEFNRIPCRFGEWRPALGGQPLASNTGDSSRYFSHNQHA